MNYMFLPLRRYFDFSGRSRRMEFWMFMLFQFLVGMVFNLVFFGLMLGPFIRFMTDAQRLQQEQMSRSYGSSYDGYGDRTDDFGRSQGSDLNAEQAALFQDFLADIGPAGITLLIISVLWSLFLLIPNLAVTVRRLHDSNRTGWWILAPLIPYLIGVVATILAIAAGGGSEGSAIVGSIVMLVAMLAYFAMLVMLLVFMFLDGTRGPNRFGPDPKFPAYGETFR